MPEGRKYDASKLRYDLIPVGPMAEVALVYTKGAAKYADRNWELGIEWSRVYAAVQRHLNAYWGGERLDPELGTNHLANAVWGLLALMEFETTHPKLDDRKKMHAAPQTPQTGQGNTEYSKEFIKDAHKDALSRKGRVQCPRCTLWYNEKNIHWCPFAVADAPSYVPQSGDADATGVP